MAISDVFGITNNMPSIRETWGKQLLPHRFVTRFIAIMVVLRTVNFSRAHEYSVDRIEKYEPKAIGQARGKGTDKDLEMVKIPKKDPSS